MSEITPVHELLRRIERTHDAACRARGQMYGPPSGAPPAKPTKADAAYLKARQDFDNAVGALRLWTEDALTLLARMEFDGDGSCPICYSGYHEHSADCLLCRAILRATGT